MEELLEQQIKMTAMHSAISLYCCFYGRGGSGTGGIPGIEGVPPEELIGYLEENGLVDVLKNLQQFLMEVALSGD